MTITTTLRRIRAHSPCAAGWKKLLAHLGKTQADDEPVPFSVILDSNGLDDALWCCRAEPQHSREWRLFAVRCARGVQHLITDQRSIAALDVAGRHADGLATDDELAAARAAAWAASQAATWSASRDASHDAAWSASRAAAQAASLDAARDAAHAAARSAAWAAALSAARAAVWDASRDAKLAAARDAALSKMADDFRAVVA